MDYLLFTRKDLPPPRAFHALAAAVFVCLVLLAPGTSRAGDRPLRLAMSGAFQPFSTTDAEGRLVGFDADIATEVARRLGRAPVLVQTEWAGIQAGLQSGKFDLICGSMAITPDRLERMHFSLPYYVSGAQVFAREGLRSLEGKRIGVTEDSTYARYIAEHPGEFPNTRVLRYGSEAEIVAAMNTGKIDAFVSDLIVGGFYIARGGAAEITPYGGLLYREAVGIAARLDSPGLVHRVNRALFSMITDGTYGEIYNRWVGADPDLGVLFASWGEWTGEIPPVAGAGTSGTGAGNGEESAAEFATETVEMVPILAEGAVLTIKLSLITALAALFTGSALGVATASRSVLASSLARGYIWVVRGTPLLVQLFISYFVVATMVNRAVGSEAVGAFGAALIALVANTTAYNAETVRGGIGSVPGGQWDAAASLGMARGRIMRRIILPQAFRNTVASLGNNLVVLIKDTSLVGAITLVELTYSARNVVFQSGQAFLPFFLAAGFYLVIITVVTLAVKGWEKRMGRSSQGVRETI